MSKLGLVSSRRAEELYSHSELFPPSASGSRRWRCSFGRDTEADSQLMLLTADTALISIIPGEYPLLALHAPLRLLLSLRSRHARLSCRGCLEMGCSCCGSPDSVQGCALLCVQWWQAESS